MVELDALLPVTRPVNNVVEKTKSSIEQMRSLEEKISLGRPPKYSYLEAKTKLLEGKQVLAMPLPSSEFVSE